MAQFGRYNFSNLIETPKELNNFLRDFCELWIEHYVFKKRTQRTKKSDVK